MIPDVGCRPARALHRLLLGLLILCACSNAMALRDDVLVIVNDNSIDSPQVGAHYAQQRDIDPANIVHVNVPNSYFISWDAFRRLRDQLIHFMQANTLDDPALVPVVCQDGDPPYYCPASMDQLRAHTRIRYLVTTRGVPTRMVVDGSTLFAPDAPTSVDNYLKYWLLNYFSGDVRLEFNEREVAFGDGRGMREVIPSQDRELIVGRIDGLNREAALALVDRSLKAEADGLYGTLYGSTEFNRWADHSTSNRRSIYPDSGLSVGALSSGWRYQLGLFDESRQECIDYLDQPGALPEGKAPPHCRVQLNEDSEPILGTLYPAPGNAGSRQPQAVDALIYQGWLDGHASVGSFPALLNWRKDDQCSVTLCQDAADPVACQLSSTDIYKELNTDCVGVAAGFMGYNHQSYPVSYLAVWPTGWFQTTNTNNWNDRGHGDVDRLAFPEVRSDTGFDDTYSLWFRNTDQVADPRCYAGSDFAGQPAVPCVDERRVVLTQKIPLPAQRMNLAVPQTYRVSFRYRTDNITVPTTLGVRLFVHESGAGTAQRDYGPQTVATLTPGSTGWAQATAEFQLDPTLHAGPLYDGIKFTLETSGVFAGELGIDAVSVQETGRTEELALNGSFAGGHRQVATGDHAATFLDRLGGLAFWGSVGHHQSGGCAFCNNGLETLVYFLRGLPLGDAVWFNAARNSGILYGDPLYSPVAVRLNPVNATDTVSGVVTLQGSTVNGRDGAQVSTTYTVDICPGGDFFVCDQAATWQPTGIQGTGGAEDMVLGNWDTSVLAPEIYTLRLTVTSLNTTSGRSQIFNDYTTVDMTPPDQDADGMPDAVDNCILWPNSSQLDTDGDGFGNRCDADLDQSGFVDATDLFLFQARFFTADADADFNGDGFVDYLDLSIFASLYLLPPGPTATEGTAPGVPVVASVTTTNDGLEPLATVSVPEPIPAPESAPVPEPDPVLESVPAPESVPVVETVPAPESVPVLETVPAPEPAPVIESEPVLAPEPVSALETVPAPEQAPVLESVPMPDTEPGIPAATECAIWVINLLSSTDRADLDTLAARADSLNIRTVIEEVDIEGTRYWRLQVPGFNSLSNARNSSEDLKQSLGIENVWIFSQTQPGNSTGNVTPHRADGYCSTGTEARATPSTEYYLQVGAFREADNADRFKNRVESLDLPAGVEVSVLDTQDALHRVRVGPYQDMDALDEAQRLLEGQGIDSILLRIDEQA